MNAVLIVFQYNRRPAKLTARLQSAVCFKCVWNGLQSTRSLWVCDSLNTCRGYFGSLRSAFSPFYLPVWALGVFFDPASHWRKISWCIIHAESAQPKLLSCPPQYLRFSLTVFSFSSTLSFTFSQFISCFHLWYIFHSLFFTFCQARSMSCI